MKKDTERLAPKITIYSKKKSESVVILRRSLLGIVSVHKIKKMDNFLIYKEIHKSR